MKRLNWISSVIIFLLVGELFVRFDQKTQFFEKDDVVKIPTNVSNPDTEMHSSNNALRIMVLGDSYIYGGGIDINKNFSHQLKSLLENSGKLRFKEVEVYDVSRPSNNNLDNYNTYFRFVDKFKPQIVILGYNLNDVKDNLEKTSNDTLASASTEDLPAKSAVRKNLLQRTYYFFWNSELLKFVSKSCYNYLKSKGIIIPNTGFDEKLNAYTQNKPSWVKSKKLLTDIFVDADKRNIKFIFLLMPEIDLLEYPRLFYSADTALKHFIDPFKNLTFVNGRDIFRKKSSSEFCLSKYDGHPNEKGHLFMAKYIMNNVIEKDQNCLKPYFAKYEQ